MTTILVTALSIFKIKQGPDLPRQYRLTVALHFIEALTGFEPASEEAFSSHYLYMDL